MWDARAADHIEQAMTQLAKERVVKAEDLVASLLENAGAPIKYRINREILRRSPGAPDMLALQEEIAGNLRVRSVLAWRQEAYKAEGWIGRELHGSYGMYAGR